MPSKGKKGANAVDTTERAPLETTDDPEQSQPDEKLKIKQEIPIELLPIDLPPIWKEQYQDPVAFDECAEEQYSESIYFNKEDSGLFTAVMSGYE